MTYCQKCLKKQRKINELEDIKKVDDNSERLKKLAAFLTNEFNK